MTTVRTLARPCLLPVAAAALLAACASAGPGPRRYSRAEAAAALARLETVGLDVGEFGLDGSDAVLDGDTIAIEGLSSTLRLVNVDTEETFKHQQENDDYDEGWESYKLKMRGGSPRPVKMATPLGEEAKKFAQKFFDGVGVVRLERDHPAEIRDYYGRYLAYIFVAKGGQWINYNLECVRAGMSPYFVKYGRSRRFHDEFAKAQQEARAAGRGIWDPTKQHYDDYEERLAWWEARAAVLSRFEREMEERDEYVLLTRWDAMDKLSRRLGEEAVVLGSVSEVRLGDKGPTIVKLARNRSSDFEIVFFDKDVFLSTGLADAKGDYVRVRGVVQKYKDKHRGLEKLQIVVNLPTQVLAPRQHGASEQMPDPAPLETSAGAGQ